MCLNNTTINKEINQRQNTNERLLTNSEIPSLQQLCQNIVAGNLKCKEASFDLVLPTRFKFSLVESFKPIIQVSTISVTPFLSVVYSLAYS